MGSLQCGRHVIRGIERDVVLREIFFLFVFALSLLGGERAAFFVFVDVGEEEFALLASCDFGGAFGRELCFTKLTSGAAKNDQSTFLDLRWNDKGETDVFRFSPIRAI